VKDDKENQKIASNSFALATNEVEELPPIEFAPSTPKKDARKEQEEKELLEVSLMDDIGDDFPAEEIAKAEKAKPAVKQSSAAPKTMSAKPISVESTIFNELQGIDFDTEIREEAEGKIDWSAVSLVFTLPAAPCPSPLCFN
jgi:hypothetical protein